MCRLDWLRNIYEYFCFPSSILVHQRTVYGGGNGDSWIERVWCVFSSMAIPVIRSPRVSLHLFDYAPIPFSRRSSTATVAVICVSFSRQRVVRVPSGPFRFPFASAPFDFLAPTPCGFSVLGFTFVVRIGLLDCRGSVCICWVRLFASVIVVHLPVQVVYRTSRKLWTGLTSLMKSITGHRGRCTWYNCSQKNCVDPENYIDLELLSGEYYLYLGCELALPCFRIPLAWCHSVSVTL